MKKYFSFLLVLAVVFMFSACSEKFNVAAPYKSITVIYGLLDKADTAHYVRIQKAYLDENKSALLMAQVADSNFFSAINVKIEMIDLSSGLVFSTIIPNRVDLAAEGYPKDSGAFFNSPNYAYKFKTDLNPNYLYRIVVNNPGSGETDSADAPVIDDVTLNSLIVYFIDDTLKNRGGFDFASTNQYQTVDIVGQYTPPANFNLNGNTSPAGIAQGFIRFHWVDSNIYNGAKTPNYGDYSLGYSGFTQNAFQYSPKDLDLYGAVNSVMGIAPSNIRRLLDRCELYFYLGTYDFYNYIEAESIQGTGLTGSDIQPVYTNIKGKNVVGLFTSRGLRHGYITLTNQTVDSLVFSPITANAKIVGTVYH